MEREPGCKLVVSTLSLQHPEAGRKRRRLYGPIPWSWWLPASRLPGKTLQVGAVCWLLAGWNRSAGFELALHDRAEFGLSRFSASRGLDTLEWVGLVSVVRRPGLSPVVLVRDGTAGGTRTNGHPWKNEMATRYHRVGVERPDFEPRTVQKLSISLGAGVLDRSIQYRRRIGAVRLTQYRPFTVPAIWRLTYAAASRAHQLEEVDDCDRSSGDSPRLFDRRDPIEATA